MRFCQGLAAVAAALALFSPLAVTAADGYRVAFVEVPRLLQDAPQVALAGSFNQWDSAQHRLAGPDRNGRWSITLPLAPCRYEYLFVVNGTDWVPDPAAPSVGDGLGGRNSVLQVPGP